MAQKRLGRPRTDPDIVAAVQELAQKGWSGPKIAVKIGGDARFADRAPSLKTIQNLMRDGRMPIATDAEAWTMATAPAHEAEHVLPVLGCVIDQTFGRITRLRRDHAEWIVRIRAALPNMSAWSIYLEAGEYVKAIESGAATDELDRRLAWLAYLPTAQADEARGEAWARGALHERMSWTTAEMRGMTSVPRDEVAAVVRDAVESIRRDLKEARND